MPAKLAQGGAGYLKTTDPATKKHLKKSKIKRAIFNNAPNYEKNLESAGKKSKKWITKPVPGRKHRITDGYYKGEMCKVHTYVDEATEVVVQLCDPWGRGTERYVTIPVRALSWLIGIGVKAEP